VGQQQLLLVVLGVIVIGIAIAVGLSLFKSNAAESKRDILVSECMNLATKAIDYYKRPVSFGGGSHSFANWSIPAELDSSENGVFSAVVSPGNIVITGTGNEVLTGTDSIKVQVTVFPYSTTTTVIN
jgi:hypothetical protein